MDRNTAKEILMLNLPTYLEQKGIDINKKFNCLCPDHIDNTPSMSYDKRRNNCHCFACGANASIFKLIEWDYDVEGFSEAFKIGCELFGLDTDNPRVKPKIKPVKKKKYEQKEPEKASPDVCNKVYVALRNLCPPTEKDIEYLKNERRLDEKRIKKDYFRIVTDDKEKEVVLKKLQKITGFGKDVLKSVPGFFIKDGKLDYRVSDGIAILIRDVEGRACAVQIRRDTAGKKNRYAWFTSSFAIDNPDYDGGASPGAAKDVIVPRRPKKNLCITEGRFKAEAIADMDNIVISLQGVATWKGIEYVIEKIMEGNEVNNIYFMFDADVMSNPQLMKSLKSLTAALSNAFPDVALQAAVWKISMGKGIDDCIFNGNIKSVKFIPATSYFETCINSISDILEENGIKELKHMDQNMKEIFKEKLQERNEFLLTA